MKKKIFVLLVIISIIVLTILFINNKSIHISKKMLQEENNMESAWDFKENLNIGWNLGMSLSANIKYPELIKYKLVVDENESNQFETSHENIYTLNKKTNSKLKIIFDIPYSNLDGTLYWTIEKLMFNNTIIYLNEEFESIVEDGKLYIEIDNNKEISYDTIQINIKIKKYYENNTLEKLNFYETFWCEDVTTKELISTLKNKGFNAIRISFDIYNHVDINNKIDDLWLNRLKEIVDYCIDLDVYCLVDIIETYGLFVDNINEESVNLYISHWTDVATLFKDYDDKLLFSPFNELRNKQGDWSTTDELILDNMNNLYQVFVDTVRSTGSNNAYRNLILTTYAAGINQEIVDNFKVPNDSTYNHLLIECHNYNPVNFTFNEINLGSTDFVNEWGSLKDKKELKSIFKLFNSLVKKTKLPLIIGEFGAVDRTSVEERIEYLSYYKKQAKKYNIGLFIFDDAHDFAIIDRKTNKFINEEIIDVLVS